MREELAELMHEIWGKWWHYIFQQSAWDKESDGMLIPGHLVERWNRQMTTLYDALSEKEKDSDREVADKVLALIAASQLANIVENTKPVDDLRCEGCGKPASSLSTWTIDEEVRWLCNKCGSAVIAALPETEL